MWFMTRPIAFSLPGIARAESTTVSSGPSLTWRWSSIAMRDSADIGSPCEPVARHRTSCAGIVADVGVADLHAGGNPQIAEPLRDLASSAIMPRPTNATLRSNCAARSTRICIR